MKVLRFETLPENHVHRLGLIVLQSDVTIEDEFRHYFDGLAVSLLVSRIPFENDVTIETLRQMRNHLTASMALFPLDARFDCLGYGCTSGALHIGDNEIANLVDAQRPCRQVTNPMQAAIAAMRHLDASNIAYLAPYSEIVSQSMVDYFEQRGIHVRVAATFNESQDQLVGRISPASIKQACIELVKDQNVDAVFVSCTNMKCATIIPEIEELTGVAALSSNQVLAWHMLQLANINSSLRQKGRLFNGQ